MKERIDRLIRELEREQSYYRKFLRKGERLKKRERDNFLTERDRTILIESFVVGGLLENLITKAINRML